MAVYRPETGPSVSIWQDVAAIISRGSRDTKEPMSPAAENQQRKPNEKGECFMKCYDITFSYL